MSELQSYLESKGLSVKRSGSQLYTHCFYCKEDTSKKGRLYFDDSSDETRALHHCFLCDASGNGTSLRRHFGDPIPNEGKSLELHRKREILTEATEFYHARLTPEHRKYLTEERGLTDETIDQFKLGSASASGLGGHLAGLGFSQEEVESTGLAKGGEDFLRNCVTIPYLVSGSAVQVRGKQVGAKYLTPPGQRGRLFNADSAWDAENVIVSEGEFDCMSLWQLGFNAVAVPGANAWSDTWDGYVAEAKRIFVMFDPDDAGRKGSSKLLERFGARAKNVELTVPDGFEAKDVDPNWLMVNQGWDADSFEDVLSDSIWANSLLITPREAFDQWKVTQGHGGLKLGLDRLDGYLKPGLLPGQVMVVIARTNAGKSALLYNLAQLTTLRQPDAKILLLSLEQTAGEWFERGQRIYNFHHLNTRPDRVRESAVDYWQPRLRIIDKNRVTPGEMATSLDEYCEQMGEKPDLVMVDYLGYWARGFPGKGEYDQLSNAIMETKAMAKDYGVPIIAPHQANRSGDIGAAVSVDQGRGSGVIEETGDFVLTMWNADSYKGDGDDEAELKPRTGTLNLSIEKSRHKGKGSNLKLQFGYMSLSIVGDEDTQKARMLRREVEWADYQDLDWEDAIAAHRGGTDPWIASGKERPQRGGTHE